MNKKVYITPATTQISVAPQLMQVVSGGDQVYNSSVSSSYQLGRRGGWADDDDWDADDDRDE